MLTNWKKIRELDKNRFFVNTPNKEIFLQKIKEALLDKQKKRYTCCYLYIGSIYYSISDSLFYHCIKEAESLHVDGFAIGRIIQLLYKKKYQDFTPAEFLPEILNLCEKQKLKVFLFGSHPGNKGIENAKRKLKNLFPHLKLNCSDGYVKNNQQLIDRINSFKTDILIIGLGLHKQERWIYQYKSELNVKIIINVGNYIDILAGQVKNPHVIYKKLHIRWLRRLIKEPRRLWRRYIGGLFIILLIFIYHYKTKLIKAKN